MSWQAVISLFFISLARGLSLGGSTSCLQLSLGLRREAWLSFTQQEMVD